MSANDLIKRSIIVGCIVTAIIVVVFTVWLAEKSSIALFVAPVVFTIASVLTVKVLTKPSKGALLKFNTAFMLTNTVKLLVFLTYFLVAYLTMQGEPRVPFVVVFMLLYLIFTVMDTVSLLQFYKNKKES